MEYPKKLTELYECFLRVCERHQLPQPETVAHDLLLAFCEQEGGLRQYFPKADKVKKNSRDESIVNEFSGRNMRELAKRYHVSDQTIRNVLNEQRRKKTSQLHLI